MYKRSIKSLLERALSRAPVVLLNGARQVGKTTLALELLKEKKYNYITFDDEITYLAAKGNSSGFIADLEKPVIIDEVQRVPEIFLSIKRDIDLNRIPGRYLLTGSANPLLIPTLGDSLAGRMEIVDMMPLSQGELLGIQENFIDSIFGDFPLKAPINTLTKEELYQKILKGGYPTVQHLNSEDQLAWVHSYISLLLQRDIKDLANVEKLTEFPNLLKILAARVSGLINIAEFSRETRINAKTLHRYVALLETIFIISLQSPWHTNLAIRFVKSSKLYLLDTGLLVYLLGMNIERALKDPMLMGGILENFVVSELKKQATWNKTRVQLYHFRTLNGEEVDIVLENLAGEIVGIEIKNNARVTHQDFKGMRYLQEKSKDKFIKGIILYTGTQYIPFGDNLYAMPINSLWES